MCRSTERFCSRLLVRFTFIDSLIYSFLFLIQGILYSHEYDEPPRDEELLSIRRLSSPSHGILKGGTGSPNNTKYYLPDDPKHVQVI